MIVGRPAISSLSALVVLGFMYLMTPGEPCFAQGSETVAAGTMAGSVHGPDKINISVEVSDKSGTPITGLEAADFKIFDNKLPQKILAFQAVDAGHPPALAPTVRIIIDAVNSDVLTVARERDGVSDFLKQNGGKSEYPTSLWILRNDGLTRIVGPSQDGMAMLTALNETKSQLRSIDRAQGAWGASERTGQALKLLKEMVSSDSTTPGRKLFLFLSPGWPLLSSWELDQRNWLFNDIVKVSNGLRESDITFYTLDPSSYSYSSVYEDYLKGVTKVADAQYPDLSLQVLSDHSGGQVIMGGNDIKAEINTALRDAGAYYEVSFERASGSRGTEYHDIRVTVDKPRVKLRTTAGYYLVGP